MKLQLDWSRPVQMRRVRGSIYSLDLERIPDTAGVYVFGRRYGDDFEALYVGKARNVRRRVKGQLNNLRLMSHVRDAKIGHRIVLVGSVITKPGQQIEQCLTLAERSLIRYFLSDGHDLVNISGARLRSHEIISSHRPMRFVPSPMYIDRIRR